MAAGPPAPPPPPRAHLLGVAAGLGVALGAIGWAVGGLWLQSVTDTLARASVDVVSTHPGTAALLRGGVAGAMAASAPLGAVVRLVIGRVRGRPPSWTELATATLVLVLGVQVGLGGALFATARVAVPAALDASAQTAAVTVALEQLALGEWAAAGAGGAAVILLAVGLAGAGLERTEPPASGD